jgi:hypothetical protein
MKRRKFLLGMGAVSVGGGALLGSGAFTGVESDRKVSAEVAQDPNAYLGMDKCPDSPNASFASLDDDGHLQVLMNPENPTVGNSPLGEGVNSDSHSWFNEVFQLCNQGKEDACVYIEDDAAWPKVEAGEDVPDEAVGERRVDFYLGDDPDASIVGEDRAFALPLGECRCIGVRTRTYGLSAGADLLSDIDNMVSLVADVNLECDGTPLPDPEEPECPDCTAPDPGTDDFNVTIDSIDDNAFPFIEVTTRVDTAAAGNGDLTASNFGICEETEGGSVSGFCGQTVENVTFAGGEADEAADVMLTMDASGSMNESVGDGSGDTKLERAQAGAKALVDELPSEVNIGLVTFRTEGPYDPTPKVEKPADLTASETDVKNAIDSINAGGGTPLAEGINVAQAELESPRSDPTTPDFLVLLSNGDPDPNSEGPSRQAARDARNVSDLNDSGDGSTIITIAYGDNANENLKEDLSSPPKVDDDTIDGQDENAFLGTPGNIDAVFENIGQIISGTYILEYETTNPVDPGTTRNVRVYVDDPSEGDADETGSYIAPP